MTSSIHLWHNHPLNLYTDTSPQQQSSYTTATWNEKPLQYWLLKEWCQNICEIWKNTCDLKYTLNTNRTQQKWETVNIADYMHQTHLNYIYCYINIKKKKREMFLWSDLTSYWSTASQTNFYKNGLLWRLLSVTDIWSTYSTMSNVSHPVTWYFLSAGVFRLYI